MKFQNLIYATMVACAFSACSNDDDPTVDPAQELDATLTVAFNAVGSNGGGLRSLQTKAEKDNQFNKIGKIGIAVFNTGAMNGTVAENGLISYLVREKAASDIDTTACISAKSGSVKVLVVANPTDNMFTGKTNYNEFLQAISDANIDKESLLMSSAARTVTLAKGRNTIAANASTVFKTATDGDNSGNVASTENIKVYRNVARIEVSKITVEPREGFGKGKTAKFTLNAIYASKVRSSVMVFGAATEWCSVVKSDASLLNGDEINSGGVSTYPNYMKTFTENNVVNYGGANSGYLDFDADKTMLFVYDNSSATAISKNDATRLVIRGTYEYTTDGGTTAKSENAYWTTIINNGTTPQGGEGFAAHNGVLRNVKYLVNVKITGPGSTSEDPDGNAASLTANIQVVDWGVVEHNPDID